MDKIDRIIQESIDNLINEARRGHDPWAGFEGTKTTVLKNNTAYRFNDGTGKDKKKVDSIVGRPEKPHKKREVAKDIFSANPNNASQIRRTLRKSWESTLFPMYHLLSKFMKQYGNYNANWLLNQFGEVDETGKLTGKGLDTLYNQKYDEISRYTTDIEGYGSDVDHIKKRCGEIAVSLKDIIRILNNMCDCCKRIRKGIKGGIKDPRVNPRIIDGYLTSGGLKQKPIYNDKSSNTMRELNAYIDKLVDTLEFISSYQQPIEMSDNELGITTIRR